MFSFKLLGGALVEGPRGPLGGRVSQRRRLALLAVLALAGGRPLSRDKLLALFWPESDTERARHSLASLLY
jgi:DNA-binding SARP family transcriptional activator